MKNSKLLLTLFLALSFSFVACDDDDDDEPAVVTSSGSSTTQATIVDIAVADTTFGLDSLVKALSTANLVTTFNNPGTYTVFAPTNTAFVNLLATDPSWNAISDIPLSALTNVLTYHVLPNEVRSGDLTEDSYAATLNTQGSSNNESTVLEIDLTPNPRINNSANILPTGLDIEASNGVIHIIDGVISAQNTVELALNDERFTTLVAALQVFGDTLTSALISFSSSTIFAPTNDAFQALLDSDTTWNTLSDIPRGPLRNILLYHVNGTDNFQAKDLMDNQVISTASANNTITVDLSNGAKLETPTQSVNIIVTDVQGTNGVIHAIDQVLLP